MNRDNFREDSNEPEKSRSTPSENGRKGQPPQDENNEHKEPENGNDGVQDTGPDQISEDQTNNASTPLPPEVSDAEGHVIIGKGTDLNELPKNSHADQIKQLDTEKLLIPEHVFQKAPRLIRDFQGIFLGAQERQVAFVSFIAILSGVIKNVVGIYNGMTLYCNLLFFLVGPYGSGKGAMGYAYRAALSIHKKLREQAEADMQQYEEDKLEYEAALAAWTKNGEGEKPKKPEKPNLLTLFLPGNSTKAKVMKILINNLLMPLIMFETEGSTVADMWSTSMGNSSDIFRKALHNEPCSQARSTDDSHYEVKHTILSCLFSMTFDQLLQLVPNAMNGLLSRILVLLTQATPTFENVFDSAKERYEAETDKIGERVMQLYESLDSIGSDKPIRVDLTSSQKARFLSVYHELKNDSFENVGEETAGDIHRQAVMCFKVCMILSTVRAFEEGHMREVITCTDDDFECAMGLMDVLRKHALVVYERMPKPQLGAQPKKGKMDPSDEYQLRLRAKELHGSGMSYRKIAIVLFGSESQRMTIYRWLN